jgi:putative chitinase
MSLKHLQKKVSVTADGAFGSGTLKAAVNYYKMSPIRAVHFFAQCAHESGGFTVFNENLNYSARGLQSTFKKYFPDAATAKKYERKPEMIANRVYASRMGNGDEKSGDGWKFRGRGAIQLTGKSNYLAFSKHIGDPEVMTNPDIVATKYSFESAMFFFETNGLWAICDKGVGDATILALTKRINGGTHGLDDRKDKTKKYATMLGVIKG